MTDTPPPSSAGPGGGSLPPPAAPMPSGPLPPPDPAAAPEPAPAAPSASPAAAPAPAPDPNGLGVAVARLGNASRKNARVALGITSVSLDDGEVIELVVQGEVDGAPGVAVLSDRRLLLVNEAAWVPLVETIEVGRDLQVEGEADGRTASLTITTAGGTRRLSGSREVDLTKGFAARLRARAAGG